VGIHCGMAFCGAIGSEYKISLRAMGHDVSVAKSLCRVAKKYKLGHLFSSNIYKLAPYLHNISRKIDDITFIEK
jgi:class 3 adenylate cyclase